jgi:hypothetical protein
MMNDDLQRRELKFESDRKRAFEKWLDDPMVRLGLSLIPAGEHQDALQMLLRSAFEAGSGQGVSSVVATMVEGMIKKDRPS